MGKANGIGLLDDVAVAELLQVSAETLRSWRSTGKGPAYRKVGRRCLYEEADVRGWVTRQPKRTPGVQADPTDS
ncbi:MAG: helix-turn-helix domain-containing protein [Gemmatimonadaceae bacterium]|nr:helix-turn-helix domain-containing protein [Gemmatimonadaceae bacterium]